MYALIDPLTDEVRYVGCTVRLEERFRGHLKQAANPASKLIPKIEWLRSLNGVEPRLLLLETVEEPDLHNAEKRWILKLRAAGAQLTNQRVGGKAPRGHKRSEETRAKIRAARAQQTFSDESRQKMSLAQKKIWAETPDDVRRKRKERVAALGRLTGAAAAAKGHKVWIGRKHSDESRQKNREAHLGVSLSESQAENIRLSHQTPEYKEKASRNAKKTWSDPEYRQQGSERTKGLWADPVYRKNMLKARKRAAEARREADNS